MLQGRVLAAAHNTVRRDRDPTAHAEINGIPATTLALASIDPGGGTLYSTCDPCPMCLAACHGSKLDRVVFGSRIADPTAAGFSELHIPAADLARLGRSPLKVEGGFFARSARPCSKSGGRRGMPGRLESKTYSG